MRLAIVRQRYNPFGGAERFVERALTALIAQGAWVTLIARDWKGGSDSGFDTILCPPPAHSLFNGRTGRDRAFARCVQKTITERDFDLVQTHERIPGCSIFRTRRWSPCRVAGSPRALHFAFEAFHPELLRLPPLRTFGRTSHVCTSALQAVICNSQMVASEIAEIYGLDRGKLHVIYNGSTPKTSTPAWQKPTARKLGLRQESRCPAAALCRQRLRAEGVCRNCCAPLPRSNGVTPT